jgi:hypothetical protein
MGQCGHAGRRRLGQQDPQLVGHRRTRARAVCQRVEGPQGVQVATGTHGVTQLLMASTALVAGRTEQQSAGHGIDGGQFGAVFLEPLQADVRVPHRSQGAAEPFQLSLEGGEPRLGATRRFGGGHNLDGGIVRAIGQ